MNMLSLLIAFEVVGPCSTKPLHASNLLEALTVGEATVRTLDKHKIPYQGNERGMNTMFKLGNDMEILSDSDMRAYGWCFDIDGEVPESYADEIPLHEGMKKVRWFHGYAEMKNGQWVSQCRETAKLKPEFLCGKN